ncbi:MAG TPA: bifunctional diguanylate cyclase/phosphodiesterase [Devosia sp.]|nr:bifunctional diguanylate cyclase/phosphodiesterase [Devosia sp.]
MRSDSSLNSVLGVYRRFSGLRWGLVGLALLLVVAGLVLGLGDGAVEPGLLALAATALVTLATLQRLAERSLRQRLAEADVQRWQAIDMAHRDALTGVYNRAYFLSQLQERMGRGGRIPVGYLQVDMDHLKALNDGLGHAAGDTALLHLTNTIRRLRPEAVLGRLGGDEFGVALIGEGSKPALLRLGEQILEALRQEVLIADRMMPLSATIGAAVAPQDAEDVAELMSRADLALYRGKRNGRSQVIGYDRDMLIDERHHRFVQRELRGALLLNEIKVYYQPIFRSDGTTLRSYEALVRWHHAHRGVIPPSEFIPIAEQSDIIDRLSEAMLRQVCADLPRLGVPVAVNISPVQLRRAGFASRFAAVLMENGVSGDRIVVEITENVLMRAGGVESANLDALRALGVRIAIDDLGTGHASLEYLRSFSFDIIKIDRSYVAHLLTSAIDRTIVAALCDIARAVNVEVVAEGVETEEQLAALREIGCHAVQGYLFGRPAPLALGPDALKAIASAA